MDHDTGARTADHSRRSALRAGAAVAWAVPVMTVLGTSSAHADVASGPPTGPGTITTPPSVNIPPPGAATVPPQPAGTPPVQTSTTVAAAPTTAPTVRAARVAAAPELARTGSEAGPLAIAGLGLVAGGAAVIAATRRAQGDAAEGQS